MLLNPMKPTLAIVIPIGPGDNAWHGLLPQLDHVIAKEIALVLPSERPGDPVPLTNERLLMVIARAGWARQLNAGARATESDWLWFLHADSRLDAGTIDALYAFVDGNPMALGYFNLRFLADGPRWTAINALGSRWRSRWLGLPFGDQGFVMPRRVYDALGGFNETLASGEDHAMIWQAKQCGIPLRALPATLLTSARKYSEQGWWRTTATHLQLTWRQARRFSQLGTVR
jgi:GT2 family glycosyltransferase